MKHTLFWIIVLLANILFIFLHLHKQSTFIKRTYKIQKAQRLHTDLVEEKKELINQLHIAQNYSSVKEHAIKNEHMIPLRLTEVKRLAS